MAIVMSVYVSLCDIQEPSVFFRETLMSQVFSFRKVQFKHLFYMGGVYNFLCLVFQDKTNVTCFRGVLMCYNSVARYYAVFIQGVSE